MRYPALPLIFLTASIGSISTAQVLDFTDLVTLRDPQLSVTVTKLDGATFSWQCGTPNPSEQPGTYGIGSGCLNGIPRDYRYLFGTDSAGQFYFVTGNPPSLPCDVFTYFGVIWRPTGHGEADAIAFVNLSLP